MNFKEYQEKSKTTAVYPRPNVNDRYTKIYVSEEVQNAAGFIPIAYCALGIAGESGEVVEQVKKSWRNNMKITEDRKYNIDSEIRDVLWYCAQLATELDLSLADIAINNLNKLEDRKNTNSLKYE